MEVFMVFQMVSFKKGNVLDKGWVENANQIKRFAENRPNADSFHVIPRDSSQKHFISGFRMSPTRIVWQKEQLPSIMPFARMA
jgi:hypothetical protein